MDRPSGPIFASRVGMKSVALASAVLLQIAAIPAIAQAAPNSPEEDHPATNPTSSSAELPVHVGVAARTDVPLFVGAEAMLEHRSTRLRLTAAVGALPSSYARLVNSAVSGAGAYDSRVANALDETMTSGFAWNAHLGFRPFADHGLLLEVGYASATFAASGDAQSLVSGGFSSPAGVDTSFKLSSHLQMVDLRVGWEWVVADHMLIQASGGLSRVVGASTSLDSALAQNALGTSTADLDSAFRRYGYIPTVSLAVGYRF
jgi:hypothetical protein